MYQMSLWLKTLGLYSGHTFIQTEFQLYIQEIYNNYNIAHKKFNKLLLIYTTIKRNSEYIST